MMIDTRISLSTNECKALLSKYFDVDVCNFVAYIDTKHGDNVLVLSSGKISMVFNNTKMEEIIISLFNNDVSKIDNVHVYIVNKEDRKYVGVTCIMSKEGIKSIMGIIE